MGGIFIGVIVNGTIMAWILGTSASFNRPWGIAVDGNNNVLVADTNNHCIRRIATDGTVTTLKSFKRNHTGMCMHAYVCACVCVCMCTCSCMCYVLCMYVCIHVCLSVYMCVYMMCVCVRACLRVDGNEAVSESMCLSVRSISLFQCIFVYASE